MTSFNDRMRTAREAKGLSYENAAYELRAHLDPAQWVSSSTVRRVERGPEEKADPVVLWALAHVYDVPLSELSERAAKWITSRFVMADDQAGSESRWFPTSPGQRPRRKRRRGEKHIDLAKRQRPVKVMLTAA